MKSVPPRSLLAFAAAICLPATLQADPPASTTGWSVTFNDDFNGSSLDGNKWITTWSQGNRFVSWSQEWMLDSNVPVANGACHIMQRINPTSGRDESGVICAYSNAASGPHWQQLYGYFEARLQATNHPGTLNAFWMASPVNWPPELDVTEILGKDPTTAYLTQHWYDSSQTDNNAYNQTTWSGADFSAGWHTFGTYWSPSTVIWYVDGVEKKRMANHNTQAQFLMANIHAGNSWAGYPSASDTNSYYMNVDYIRAWTKSDYSVTPGEEFLLYPTGWVASASSSDAANPPAKALDGNSSTAWNSGGKQVYGAWYKVDMGSSQTLNKILIDAGAQTNGISSWLEIDGSQDNTNWTRIWWGYGAAQQYLYFNPTTARYLKLINEGDGRATPWTIAELKVYHDTGSIGARYEAESLAVAGTSGVTNSQSADSLASNGQYEQVNSSASGNSIVFTAPNISAGNYSVRVGVKSGSNLGTFQLAASRADNTAYSNIGGVQDEYAASAGHPEVDLGIWSPATTSDKHFRFTVIGKNDAGSGYNLAIDYIALVPQ